MAEKWNVCEINGQPATITRFKAMDSVGRGFLTLYYEPSDGKDPNIKRPTFHPTKKAAEDFLLRQKKASEIRVASYWWNKAE